MAPVSVQQRMTEANRLTPIIFLAKAAVVVLRCQRASQHCCSARPVSFCIGCSKRVPILAHLVFPNRAGLMPGIVAYAQDGYAALPPNETGAQIMAASVSGHGRITAAQIRAARQDWAHSEPGQPDELVEPSLPTSAPVYSATLPSTLSLPVGVTGGDEPVVYPFRNLGNIVIGGLQGYGKSELLGAIIAGLLRQDPHGQLWRLGLIDMKGADFCRLPPDLSALQWPVVQNDVPGALALLSAAQAEYEARNGAFRRAGVPNIETYNQRSSAPMPYILIVVDEIMFFDRYGE